MWLIVCEKVIGMDRNEVIEFIKRNTNSEEGFYDIEETIIESMLQMIPFLGRYEEEDKKINFKIALGMDKDMKNLIASSYPLKKYIWVEENIKDRTTKIVKMIKDVAVFCERNADIFLVQNENEIECGVFFPNINTTEVTEEGFLEKGFIMFEHIYRNSILVSAKNERLFINMDFEKEHFDIGNKTVEKLCEHPTYTKWKGIFERVRKSVHGTICLIVDSRWKSDSDKNFIGKISSIDLDLQYGSPNNINNLMDFNNKLEMFLAMLNYDGITIIDTNEQIRAYNLICKVNESTGVVNGGARHKAFNSLKNLEVENRIGYVAIYFQSQEGEIEFYEFPNSEDAQPKVLNVFDASIMVNRREAIGGKYNKIVEKYNKMQESSTKDLPSDSEIDKSIFETLNAYVEELDKAHNEFNNFYSEPIYAGKLNTYILKENNNEKVYIILEKHKKLRKEFINIIMKCLVGSVCGYSWGAEDYLKEIVDNIPEKVWRNYFENEEYLEPELLWSISRAELDKRWLEILDRIKEMYPDLIEMVNNIECSREEYRKMYEALTCKDEISKCEVDVEGSGDSSKL